MESFGRAAHLLADSAQPAGKPQPKLEKQLSTLYFVTHGNLSVYTVGGALLASAGEKPPGPLTADLARVLMNGKTPYRHSIGSVYAPIPGKIPAYLAVILHDESDMLRRFVVGLLVAIGAMSLPLARSIAKPIQSMTSAALKLKSGDLSARVEVAAGDELGLLAGTLNDMAAGLDARIRLEKELLANVSHELRTPLSRMRVALEIAAAPETSPARHRELLEGISADAVELEQLVDNVLTSTRLDLSAANNGVPLKLEEWDMQTVLDTAAAKFREISKRPLALEIERAAAPMKLDRTLFLRVIGNLLHNADKYADPGTPVTLAGGVKDNIYIVEIRDRGPGVPADALQRIFEPFYRCDESRNKNTGGVGLGLALCKQIAKAHGGSIVAESRDKSNGDKGLTVRIEIPRR
jgi:signal transduction histidine kinase